MKVFLIGFMGSGKSTAAGELSHISGMPFLDMDNELELRHKQSVQDIFAQYGEEYFRKAERKLLEEACQLSSYIIATGGGTPCFADNMDMINQYGISVYLKCSIEELYQWLKHHKTNRPLISDKSDDDLKQYITRELDIREPFYSKTHIVVPSYSTNPVKLWKMIEEYSGYNK